MLSKLRALDSSIEELRDLFLKYCIVSQNVFDVRNAQDYEDAFDELGSEIYEEENAIFQDFHFSLKQMEHMMNHLGSKKKYDFDSIVCSKKYFELERRKYFLLLMSWTNRVSLSQKLSLENKSKLFQNTLLFELIFRIIHAEVTGEKYIEDAIYLTNHLLYLVFGGIDYSFLEEQLKNHGLKEEYNQFKREDLYCSLRQTLNSLNQVSFEEFHNKLTYYPYLMTILARISLADFDIELLIHECISDSKKQACIKLSYKK
ncbi:TPA: hypothetical protein IAB95_06860 [Candidatus Ventrenecus avicola]|nr:hypothetical protein [Candidatus Ventrenecus avicola]